jgi:AcrR family transcriptional regulator
VTEQVKRRRYDSSGRRAEAEQTKLRVLRAARGLFAARGYAGTSVADIARAAGVSVDTLYASVGRKPQLLLAVHDMELAGGDVPVDAEQRPYVIRIREAATASDKIAIYAQALADVLPRTVPLLDALREAGRVDPECREVWQTVNDRRAANMRRFAADLRSTGELREELRDEEIADVVWSMTGPDFYLLMRSRGRTPQQYAALVRDVWTRTFLRTPARDNK